MSSMESERGRLSAGNVASNVNKLHDLIELISEFECTSSIESDRARFGGGKELEKEAPSNDKDSIEKDTMLFVGGKALGDSTSIDSDRFLFIKPVVLEFFGEGDVRSITS